MQLGYVARIGQPSLANKFADLHLVDAKKRGTTDVHISLASGTCACHNHAAAPGPAAAAAAHAEAGQACQSGAPAASGAKAAQEASAAAVADTAAYAGQQEQLVADACATLPATSAAEPAPAPADAAVDAAAPSHSAAASGLPQPCAGVAPASSAGAAVATQGAPAAAAEAAAAVAAAAVDGQVVTAAGTCGSCFCPCHFDKSQAEAAAANPGVTPYPTLGDHQVCTACRGCATWDAPLRGALLGWIWLPPRLTSLTRHQRTPSHIALVCMVVLTKA